ncbi:MAG TPA: histidine--tRNA ligase [Gemmatimonadaceae bacterium]|nr:histidine--tRNA ligase [Gemmatimonadaceae bacterium]
MAQAGGALPGFRDFYPEQFAERAYVTKVWREVAHRYAFVEYDGPPLEPLDLYTKKSGDEIVGQLYNFTDKGGREVSLRPEMTPTLARMVSARANALRKPVRWFSIPQLFRYERQQRGRLREHFQLNVDIIGESDVTADAELLAVAIDIMREFGLTHEDVRARVSDRRLLRALLEGLGATEDQQPAIFAVIDKVHRQPRDISEEKLAAAGLNAKTAASVLALTESADLATVESRWGSLPGVAEPLGEMRRYLDQLALLGVADWVSLDLSIVRGLAYYTGIVFELFDAKGELRAICGGGRYDQLLGSMGGPDLPALGFGMGDVVLTELLRDRGLNVTTDSPDFWIAGEDALERDVVRTAAALRRAGASVEYALRKQQIGKQRKAAQSAGVTYFVTLESGFETTGGIKVEELGERDGVEPSPLMRALANAPATVSSLLAALNENPRLL